MRLLLTVIMLCLSLSLTPLLAQDHVVSLDQGEGAVGLDRVRAGKLVTFQLRITNNSDHHFNMGTLFRLWSPDGAEWRYPERFTYFDSMPPIVCDVPPICFDTSYDSIYVDPVFREGFDFSSSVVVYRSADGFLSDTVGWLLSGWINPLMGLPPWYDDDPLGIPVELRLSDTGRTICIDSGSYDDSDSHPPIVTWRWAGGISVTPEWSGPHCFTITNRCCRGFAGNVDYDVENVVDIGDLTALIGYLYIPPNTEPFCLDEANVDGAGEVDIGDLTTLIAYLYIPPNSEPAGCE
jgi:hypothetical protein